MSVKVRQIRKKASGEVVWGLKIDHKGKRKTISIGGKKAAEKAKLHAELSLAKNTLQVKRAAPSFPEVAKNWLIYVEASRSLGTYTRYKGIVEKFLNKPLSKPIDQITRGDIRDLLLKVYNKGSSRASVELIHSVASGVFMYALDDELITTLPTQLILKRLDLKKDSKDINPFTADEFNAVLSTSDSKYRDFFLTAFHTGCRVGELCALEWSDINFRASTIKISKTAKEQVVKQSTKTHTTREIDLSEALHPVLINLKKSDKELCFKLGVKLKYVFHEKGMLLSQNTIRRKLVAACKKAGIDHKTPHDIRHTTASILLSRGTPLLYVSKLLGHSSPKMTLDKYSHYMPSENKGMINNLDIGKKVVYKPFVD